MKIRKIGYIVLGCVGVGLGAVGAVLPLLPAFPFLLLEYFRWSGRIMNTVPKRKTGGKR